MTKSKLTVALVSLLILSGYFGYATTVSAKSNTKSAGIINLKINPASTRSKNRKQPQKTYARAIKSISGKTLTIEVDKVSYKVTVLANTIIVNSKGKNILFSDLKVGHFIRVVGIFTPSNTKAQWIQDTSL